MIRFRALSNSCAAAVPTTTANSSAFMQVSPRVQRLSDRFQYLVDVENAFRLFQIGIQHGVANPSFVTPLKHLKQDFFGGAENLPFCSKICRCLVGRSGIPRQEKGESLGSVLELPKGALHLVAVDS